MGKQTHKTNGITKEFLERLYCVDGLSDAEIGASQSVTGEAIAYFRKKYSIRTLSPAERTAINARRLGLKDITATSDDELKELYKRHGMLALGKMFGCSKIPIRARLRRMGVISMQKRDRIILHHPIDFNQQQKELIIGSLLGDGHIEENNANDAAHYQEQHAAWQRSYLEWKHCILIPFSHRIHRDDKVESDGRVSKCFGFKTCVHPLFLQYRTMFYDANRVKHLPAGLMDTITPFSIAVWYMDDGHLKKTFFPEDLVNKDGVFTLASSFCKDEIAEIVERLNARFNFDIEPREQPEDGITNLFIHNKQRFFDVVGKHIIPTMAYKVPLSLRFHMPHVAKPHLYDLPLRLTPEEIAAPSPGLLNDLTEHWGVVGFPYPLSPLKEERVAEIESVKLSVVDLNSVIPQGNNKGCGLFMSTFKHFWTVKRHGKKSPMDVFNDAAQRKTAIEKSIKYRGGCTESLLRAELRTYGGVQTFRPAVAKAIYDRYCQAGGRALDPCAGWGGRLLGFYTSGATEYVGIDANPDTVKGLKHVKCIVDRHIPGKTVDIRYAAFEDIDIGGEFDLVFTSPPYFCKELYGDDDFQSHVRYKTYLEWRDKFLKPLIEKSVGLLKNGGYLVLNVADVKIGGEFFGIADDTRNLMRSTIGILCEHSMEFKNQYGDDSKFEPIIVGRKGE